MNPLKAQLEDFATQLGDARKEITDLRTKEAQRDEHVISATPALSLKELMSQQIFGAKEAQIDGRSALAKDKPVETAHKPKSQTGIEFIDALLAYNQQVASQ